MIILGIDPGTRLIGYGVLECGHGKPQLLASGLIDIPKTEGGERLRAIQKGMENLFSQWRPDAISVEKLFFAKNVKTAISVAEARGIILLTASMQRTTLFEYTPLEVKKAVTGQGNADKTQVEKIIRLEIVGAKNLKARDDVFDAIAIAFTAHLLTRFG